MTTDPGPPDDDLGDAATLAGELALGVLEGEERAAALRRTLADPAFAAEVERWRARLAPLLDGIGEVVPPDGAWPRIAAAIAGPPPARGTVAALWRAAAIVATTIAACLMLIVVNRPPAPPAPPTAAPAAALFAQIADADAQPIVTARFAADTGRLRVRTDHLPPGERRPELWLIAADGTPRSLGQVATSGTAELTPPPGLRAALTEGVTIAVTLEPREGAPHAKPSGTILGTARLVAV